jgi:thiamine biosynthesis lipoprotein
MDRREFLHPRRLMEAAAPVLGLADEIESLQRAEESSSETVLLRFARQAMATTFEVIIPFGTDAACQSATAALDEIDRLEAQLTVYRDTSEVSRLNARAFHHPVRVETGLFELLALAEKIHRGTEGAFDISVGVLIKAWGFYRRAGRVPPPHERAAVRDRIGMQHVLLDAQGHTVRYERQGLEINLGSIGKGYALDRAAGLMSQTEHFLMHGGHSGVLARGNEAPGKTGWTVGLLDPEQPRRRRGLLTLRNRAMATSALTYQHIEHEGKKLGHLLDPRTAWPAKGTLSATATAPTAAEADALATAFFILGAEKTQAYCEQHPTIGAVLVCAAAPHRLHILGHAATEVREH